VSHKVNRCLAELFAFVDGEADAARTVELRAHLRQCLACRATVRGAARGLASAERGLPGSRGRGGQRRGAHRELLFRRFAHVVGLQLPRLLRSFVGLRRPDEWGSLPGVDWYFCEPRDPQAKGVVERLQDFIEMRHEALLVRAG
jgi:Putative zinc-finger